MFVYNGGVEPWAQPALDAVADEGVLPVEAGKAFMTEQNSRLDPHFWLSPRKAETEVLAVRDAFIKADPANTAAYEKNAADYIERLKELDRKMAAVTTKQHRIKHFVTTQCGIWGIWQQITVETDFHYGAVAAVGAFSGGAEQTGWRYACGKKLNTYFLKHW